MLSYSAQNVLLGSTLLGAVGGMLGAFALLRRQSLLGDALAHAALPGVCLAFLWTQSKNPLVVLGGALASGLLGSLAILGITRWSRIKQDTAIGIVLSVSFGLGIVLLTHIQKLPGGNQSGLDRFLFGQAAALMRSDLARMAVLGLLLLGLVALLWKELKLVTFDRDFAGALGLPVGLLEVVLTLALVVAVVVGLQTVGVVLMIATLVTPAAAARQWTDRLGLMVVLSALLGAGTSAAGALASAALAVPTGPAIVLLGGGVLLVSLLFAPRRGLVRAFLAERALRRRIRSENLLKDLWLERERGGEARPGATFPALMGLRGARVAEIERTVAPLARRGLVTVQGEWLRLTDAGRQEAERVVRKHRLWEVYLAERLRLPPDHLHRDAEMMEHALSDQHLEELDRLLGHPASDPHGRPIPRRGTA
ncbi:MAG TPA: iron chelate uptake ABC transporter family permease subunit [Candidatus Polarisedimenticolaceae bacterium]|nr:iron chelate uptake ABC transporter family permease subunit [Candidatus Polarisedimenticolaceae bacterium]